MSEIRVDTGDLRTGSSNLDDAGHEIGDVQSQLSGLPSRAGNVYDGQLRKALESIIGGDMRIALFLASRSYDLRDELLGRAEGFEAANEASKIGMLSLADQGTGFLQGSPIFRALAFLVGPNMAKAVFLWGAGGLGIGGLVTWITLIGAPVSPQITPPRPTETALIATAKAAAQQQIEQFNRIRTGVEEGTQYQSDNSVVDASINNYSDQCTAYVAYRRPDIVAAPHGKLWLAAHEVSHETGTQPRVGAIMVEGPTEQNPYGHVAYVERVNSDGTIVVSEQNRPIGSAAQIRIIDPQTRPVEGYIYGPK